MTGKEMTGRENKSSHIKTRICMAMFAALCFTLQLFPETRAASMMTVGQDEGYSGKVMDKVIAKWSPPPQFKGDYKLKLRISLDGDGRVLECKAQKSSGVEALDIAACGAVNSAGPFGSPPYGMPADIYLSFWTGNPGHKMLTEPESPKPDTTLSRAAATAAQAANERAKSRAEEASRKTGKHLDIGASRSQGAKKTATPPREVQASQNQPGIPAVDSSATPTTAEKVGPQYAKYISRVTWDLRKAMYVPVQSKPGIYHVTARVNCDSTGKILSSSILAGSGDSLIDKYVLQGIKRAKKIAPPPPELGNSLDLEFKLVRN